MLSISDENEVTVWGATAKLERQYEILTQRFCELLVEDGAGTQTYIALTLLESAIKGLKAAHFSMQKTKDREVR